VAQIEIGLSSSSLFDLFFFDQFYELKPVMVKTRRHLKT